MNRGLTIIGVIIALTGGVFTLQGIGILPGSVMSNDPTWAVIGSIMIIAGGGLAIWDRRRGRASSA